MNTQIDSLSRDFEALRAFALQAINECDQAIAAVGTERTNDDVLSYSYDTLNRLCSKAIASVPTSCTATSSSNPTTWYTHDLDGRLAQAHDNSAAIQVATTGATYTETLTYDPLNHPLTVDWTPAAAATSRAPANVTFNYGYDKNNRRTSQTATDKSWWDYPTAAGNVSYTTNALNQYTAVGSFEPMYNADGDLTGDGSFTYGYDPENRMISAVSFATGQPVSSYTYDALGRRNGKTVASSGTATVYVTDPDGREILEYDGTTGATNAWYAYGPGPNDVVSRMVVGGAGVRTTMIPDIQGSIIGTLNTGILVPIGKSGYQPYGDNMTVTTGTFRYTGQRFDPETAGSPAEPSGLYYYRSRMYSPGLGRFMQPDTIGYQDSPAGMNLYAYVNNDPLNETDPEGQCYPECTVLIGGAIGGLVGGGAYIGYNWNNFTWIGLLARTGQGATVGALAGAGYELPLLAAVEASANVTASFVQQASQGSLQNYYGDTWDQNAWQIVQDAAVGGGSVAVGQGASNVLAPIVNDVLGTFGADVLTNESVNNATAATVISAVNASSEPIAQATEALGDVGFEYLSDWTAEALSKISIPNAPSESAQPEK